MNFSVVSKSGGKKVSKSEEKKLSAPPPVTPLDPFDHRRNFFFFFSFFFWWEPCEQYFKGALSAAADTVDFYIPHWWGVPAFRCLTHHNKQINNLLYKAQELL